MSIDRGITTLRTMISALATETGGKGVSLECTMKNISSKVCWSNGQGIARIARNAV